MLSSICYLPLRCYAIHNVQLCDPAILCKVFIVAGIRRLDYFVEIFPQIDSILITNLWLTLDLICKKY